jgi:hypothetical protein
VTSSGLDDSEAATQRLDVDELARRAAGDFQRLPLGGARSSRPGGGATSLGRAALGGWLFWLSWLALGLVAGLARGCAAG